LIERVSARKSSAPILVKIAPDLHDNDLADVTRIARKYNVAGLIISNTTIERTSVTGESSADELGGLSGRPLMARSTQVLKDVYKAVGNDMVLVGVGGIASGADAFEKIKAGASLVQLYTALIYQGPFAVKRMKRELVSCLRAEGYATLKDAIGKSVN
jgi:dihydroorotate dehydrogenase